MHSILVLSAFHPGLPFETIHPVFQHILSWFSMHSSWLTFHPSFQSTPYCMFPMQCIPASAITLLQWILHHFDTNQDHYVYRTKLYIGLHWQYWLIKQLNYLLTWSIHFKILFCNVFFSVALSQLLQPNADESAAREYASPEIKVIIQYGFQCVCSEWSPFAQCALAQWAKNCLELPIFSI